MENLIKVSQLISASSFLTAFTGAGISKESGIPVFRGDDGVYSKYDHSLLEIKNYKSRTEESWKAVKAIFYDFFAAAEPNAAHLILAKWEKQNLLKYIITQNIDNLHQAGGSKNVVEYHGTKDNFICLNCGKTYRLKDIALTEKPPYCSACGGLLKPDFVFFGEAIPEKAARLSYEMAKQTDVHLIIGTTGEVQPASHIPFHAKRSGAIIIEINPEESKFTNTITDIFLKMTASEAMIELDKVINK